MKRNILRAAIAASILGVSGAAVAESVDVPFSGTVAGACSFASVTPGTLVETGVWLDGGESAGTNGSLQVTCNGAATISIANPTSGAPIPNQGGIYSRMYATTGTMTSGNALAGNGAATPTHAHAAGSTTYRITMGVNTTDAFVAPGTYNYTVAVTAIVD
jgi:hypothetical protein